MAKNDYVYRLLNPKKAALTPTTGSKSSWKEMSICIAACLHAHYLQFARTVQEDKLQETVMKSSDPQDHTKPKTNVYFVIREPLLSSPQTDAQRSEGF